MAMTDATERHGGRRDRMLQEYRHDTYKLPGKLKEPTGCPSVRRSKHAYHGDLTVHYDQDEDFVRVTWTR
jgi:hypothetical protein